MPSDSWDFENSSTGADSGSGRSDDARSEASGPAGAAPDRSPTEPDGSDDATGVLDATEAHRLGGQTSAVPAGSFPTGPPPGAVTSTVPAGSVSPFAPPSGPTGPPSGGDVSAPSPYAAGAPVDPPSQPPTSPPIAGPGSPGSLPAPPAWSYGADPGSPQGGVPLSPPLQYRPDVPGQHGAPMAPPVQAAPPADPEPQAAQVAPAPGWGLRALVAFLAGGLVAAGGFAVATLGDDGSGAAAPVGAPTTGIPVSLDETAGDEAGADETVEVPVTEPNITSEDEPAAYVAQVLGPSVVQIETDIGIGSGVVYDDGLIITNHHVVEGADPERIKVLVSDGRTLPADLIGSSVDIDIAVIAVDQGADLPPASLAVDEPVTVGQTAVAIGSPFHLQQSVTEGIVSAVNRPVPSNQLYVAMIQTDAPINPGNSGGALADRQARVIGINTAIQTGGANANAGVGFAIPIDTAVSVADRLVAGEPIEAGFLGVRGTETEDGSAGVLVDQVTAGSAADEAGIRVGDHILSIDEAPVNTFEELAGLVVTQTPGDTIEIEIIRDGQPDTLTATLGRREGEG